MPSFDAIADLDIVKEFGLACHRLTGRCIYLVSVDPTRFRAFHDGSRMSPLCALLQSTPEGAALCRASDDKVRRLALESRTPFVHTCWAGLVDTVAPVPVENQVLGFLAAGQVLNRPPTPAGFHRLRKRLGPALPAGSLRRAYFATPVFPRKKIGELLKLFALFIRYIAEMEARVSMLSGRGEHEAVRRAKRYLSEHWRERVSLPEAAAYANVSPEHLCRLLRRHTGSTLTGLLQALRLDGAKRLLAASPAAIGELAREAGFRSPAHFDRLFRRHTGLTPSAWRRRHRF